MILSRPDLPDVVVSRFFSNTDASASGVGADGASGTAGSNTFRNLAYVGGGVVATGVCYYLAKQALAKANKKD
jgi:hypothetical protein